MVTGCRGTRWPGGDFIFANIHIPTQATFPVTSGIVVKAVMGDGSLVQIFTTSAITTPYYKPVQFTGANETGAAGQAVPSFVNGLNIAVTGANDGTQVIWVDVVGPF